jgi:hypothetical protein
VLFISSFNTISKTEKRSPSPHPNSPIKVRRSCWSHPRGAYYSAWIDTPVVSRRVDDTVWKTNVCAPLRGKFPFHTIASVCYSYQSLRSFPPPIYMSERFRRREFQNWVVRARAFRQPGMMDREEATRFLLMRRSRGLRKIAHLALDCYYHQCESRVCVCDSIGKGVD